MLSFLTMDERKMAVAQGLVWMGIGTWPLIDLDSFARVTGPKPEGWLVKTITALFVTVGATLFNAGRTRRVTPEVRRLGLVSALVLGAADVLYVSKRRISPVYLLDAALQALLVTGWAVAQRSKRSAPADR